MHQSAMMKLRLLESRKRDALANLEVAQERLEAEKSAQNNLRAQLRTENQAAAAAFEALSVQRARTGRGLRSTLHSNSWTNTEPLPETSTVAAEPSDRTRKRSGLQNQSSNKQQPEPSRKTCDSPKPGATSPKSCSDTSSLASPDRQGSSRQGLSTRGAPPPRIRPGPHSMQITSSLRSRSTSRGPATRQDASARSRTASHESMLRSASMQSLVAKSRSESRERPQRVGVVSSGAPPPTTAQFSPARATQGRTPSQDCQRRPRSVSNQRSPSRGANSRGHDLRIPPSSGVEQNEMHAIQKTANSSPNSPDAHQKQVRSLLEVVQAAQALQTKLQGMPEHLRGPISKIGASRYPQRGQGIQRRL